MTLQQLHYMITIAECGSLNRAAETLFVAQPSLSSAVRELERELGITLFYRSGKGVTLTGDGAEFLVQARQVYQQYELLLGKYKGGADLKKKFGVSAQHFSFAVRAFVELVKTYGTAKYEFAIRETRTREVIEDVATLRSEIGVLFFSDFNRPVLAKILRQSALEFHPLITCRSYVYLWRGHPLAGKDSITFAELSDYPCLSFEQGDADSFYFSEGILSTNEYPRYIKVCDRATVLNLMVGLNGYILCPRIICEELNGTEYVAVPFAEDGINRDSAMEIGYITKKNSLLTDTGIRYVEELKNYLHSAAQLAEDRVAP